MNSTFHKIFTIFLFFILNSCSAPIFKKQPELSNYLSEQHNYELQDENIILFLLGPICNTCGDLSEEILIEQFQKSIEEVINKDNSIKLLIIVPGSLVVHFKNRNFYNTKIFLDNDFKIYRYGINFDSNLVLWFNKEQTITKLNWFKWTNLNKCFQEIMSTNN